MSRVGAIGVAWLAVLLTAGVLAALGRRDVALMMVALDWAAGLLAVVWLALVGPPNPVRMPPRHLPVVPPLSQPDPLTSDLERLLTRGVHTAQAADDLAAALDALVARVPTQRRGLLPDDLLRFCAAPGRLPSHVVVDGWLADLEEATRGR